MNVDNFNAEPHEEKNLILNAYHTFKPVIADMEVRNDDYQIERVYLQQVNFCYIFAYIFYRPFVGVVINCCFELNKFLYRDAKRSLQRNSASYLF